MFLLFFFIYSSLMAVVLPPGYVVNRFNDQRQKADSVTLKQQVKQGSDFSFSEKIWFKKGSKFRAYVEKDGEAILFIREGSNCIAITSGSKIIDDGLCKDLEYNFFYNTIMPYGNFASYLKSLKVDYPYDSLQLNIPGRNYQDPVGSFIFRYGDVPIYVLGITQSMYSRAKSRATSEKPVKLGETLLNEVKNQAYQVWIDKFAFVPLRIYGVTKFDNKNVDIEVLMQNYKKDLHDFYYPSFIVINYDGVNALSYGIREFETKKELSDQLFDVVYYTNRFKKTLEVKELSENKIRLLNYLKEQR